MSRSVIEHLVTPGGVCKEAVPMGGDPLPLTLIVTRRSVALWLSM
jgi:hypothetical protein